MPQLEDMFNELSQFKDEYQADKQKSREDSFFDKYGSKFKNDRGLGLAILNELDRQGVDTSAADEAVQAILDELRTECRSLLELVDEVKDSIDEQKDKIEAISDVVNQEIAANPDATTEPGTEEPPMPEVGEMPEGGEMPLPEEPAPEAAAPEAAPEGGEVPAEIPEEVPAEPPAEEPAPETVPSDERIKNISRVVSDIRMKRIQSKGFKPSSAIIEAATRGY